MEASSPPGRPVQVTNLFLYIMLYCCRRERKKQKERERKKEREGKEKRDVIYIFKLLYFRFFLLISLILVFFFVLTVFSYKSCYSCICFCYSCFCSCCLCCVRMIESDFIISEPHISDDEFFLNLKFLSTC
jgi:hypothetical protein